MMLELRAGGLPNFPPSQRDYSRRQARQLVSYETMCPVRTRLSAVRPQYTNIISTDTPKINIYFLGES